MHEKQVWAILRDLFEERKLTESVSPEILRESIISITGVYDKGTTSRSISSLLDADIFRADYGQYKYGYRAKQLLKKFGLINDDRIDTKPEFEIETNAKLKADILVSHHADLPDLPIKYSDKHQKLKDKTKKDALNENP
jgi:hypothetical protein